MAKLLSKTYTEVDNLLRAFSDAAQAKYDSHAFSAGYYERTLCWIIAEMPAAKQKLILDQLATSSVFIK